MNIKSVLSFLMPSHWLPIERIRAVAQAEALELTGRWDVPLGKEVPPDLADTEGRFFRLANGHRIAGRMLATDAQIGFQSAAVPLLFAAVPVLTILSVIGQTLLGVAGLALPVIALVIVIGMISTAAGTGSAIGVAIFGIVLPLFGTQAAGFAQSMMAMAGSALLVVAPMALLAAFIFNSPKLRAAVAIGAGVFALGMVIQILPTQWHQVFYILLACAVPPAYALTVWRTWALKLARQGIDANLESTGPQVSAHIEARKAQTLMASKDSSAFLQLGSARGVFTTKMDGFAPDRGLPFGLTVNDLKTHMVVMGATGSGKTAGVLRPIVVQYLKAKQGGALILDGKGSLAGEFVGLPDYTLIEPGRCDLALIEGLTPEEVVIAFDQVNRPTSKSESGSAQFFRNSGRELLHHGANFLSALVGTELAKVEENPGYERQWFWTLNDLQTIVEMIQRASPSTTESTDGAVKQVMERHADASKRGTLSDTIRFIDVTLPAMDSETRANVSSTVASWIHPVSHHRDLVRWSYLEKGVNPTLCLRGHAVGVCLPELEYGAGGALIQALVKQRVFVGLRKRSRQPDWESTDQTPVLICVDEAQELCGPADQQMLPVARSLGGMALFATQQFESWATKFGDETAARGFLANFRSAVCLSSSQATLGWLQQRLGTTWSLVFANRATGIDYHGAWRSIAESPLADRSHPAHRLYARLLRRGAGVIRDASQHEHGLVHHQSSKGIDATDGKLTIPAMRGGEWKSQPLFLDAEADYLAEPFTACCEVMRGGVRRRDIVRLDPMFDVPRDLVVNEATAA